jgi:hypothetical protein
MTRSISSTRLTIWRRKSLPTGSSASPKKNGDWRDFTEDDINKIYRKKFPHGTFSFNRLIGDNKYAPIKKNDDDSFSFTHEFIAACFKASPATEKVK